MRKSIKNILLMIMLVFTYSACSNIKMSNEQPQVTKGKQLFGKYCVDCHGVDGRGIPGMVDKYKATNLTLINMRRGVEEFPIEEIAKYIDGREHVKNTGERMMPIWGVDLVAMEANYNPDTARSNMGALLSYLIRIQENY